MQKQDCFLVGTIFKLHGYKGGVKIYNEDNIPFDFSAIDFFLIELNNELVPFFITQARTTKPHNILVKFEDVTSEEEAKKLLKKKVYLQKIHLPKTAEDSLNEKQCIGFSVIDMHLGELGTVSRINTQTAQQLIYVEKEEQEFCFPWHERFVKNIDIEKEEIQVEIPEELLNLN